MKMTSLHLNLSTWGDNEGRYTGEATFETGLGNVKLNLSANQIEGIITVCAEAIVASAKEVAKELTTVILEQTASGNLLENDSEN